MPECSPDLDGHTGHPAEGGQEGELDQEPQHLGFTPK